MTKEYFPVIAHIHTPNLGNVFNKNRIIGILSHCHLMDKWRNLLPVIGDLEDTYTLLH